MNFERAQRVADAVLLEGYVLYPYRASAPKNQFRWTFGVLAPRAWSEPGGSEPWWMEAQCLVSPRARPTLRGRFRFFRARRRRIETRVGDGYREADSMEAGGRLLVPWDEGEVREVDFESDLAELAAGTEQVIPVEAPAERAIEPVTGGDGSAVGRVVRESSAVRGRVRLSADHVGGDAPLLRVCARAENLTPWDAPHAGRDAILGASCLASHIVLHAAGAEFVSLLDPPAWAREAAAACESTRSYPVLAGPKGERDLVLAAPIILYDHPQVAPESPGDFCDATEIDELLALRTFTLTPEEKRQARATDPRAADLIDRAEAMSPEMMQRLHGAARSIEDGEMVPRRARRPGGDGGAFAPGMRVVLRPGRHRTDAQDMLYAGRTATVEKVLRDTSDRDCLAVTIDDDPATELFRWHGRYYYYYVDEVEPLAIPEEEGP